MHACRSTLEDPTSYYADTLPTWLRRFNATRGGRRYAGRTWDLLLPASRYRERDSVDVENNGRDYAFPHRLPADSAQAARLLGDTPFMDELTLEAALAGLAELQLGAGPQLDLLAVSLSTTDAVGHRYGPDSREIHDQVLRVDRMLGAFLDSLFRLRDPALVVVALTADHGVAPLPELHFAGKQGAGVLRAPLGELVAETMQRLAARGLDTAAFDFEYGMVFMDRARFAAARVDADSMLADFLRRARRVPGVQRADTRRQLARADTTTDHVARRWLHALPADLPVVATVTLEPYVYWPSVTQAAHGSPHDYDARVPVIFWGAPFRAGRFTGRARVVDMAPTLAHVLGLVPSERLDGRVLRDALRPGATAADRRRGTGQGGPRP